MDAEKLFYTKEHEWIFIEGETATVGITDYAQEELGDIVFVELPESGTAVNIGDSTVTLESVKAVSAVYSPYTGEIIEVNQKLEDEPETINNSPFADGWIFKIKIKDNKNENLLSFKDYNDYIKGLD